MSNSFLTFRNELFGEVRFMEIEGKIYAVASDVLKCLGYAESGWSTTLKRKCVNLTKCKVENTRGRLIDAVIIPEGDIYRLIVGSHLESAQQFEKWVFDQVLPQIRRTGGFIPVQEEDDELTIMAKALEIAHRTLQQKDEIINLQNRQFEAVPELIPLGTVKKQQGKTLEDELKRLQYVIYEDNIIVEYNHTYLKCSNKQNKSKIINVNRLQVKVKQVN